MSIHNPIPQVDGTTDITARWMARTNCPNCRHVNTSGLDYGDIDTPPIALQIADNQRGVTREWAARRCFCPMCQHMWDVITVNKTA